MDLVIPNDRVAPRSDLHSCQCVAMDVVLLQDTTPIGKEVHAPLHPSIDIVILEGGVTFTCDPYTCVRVSEDLILDELTTPLDHEEKIDKI